MVRLTRLRLGNGRPLAIEAACLPERLVGEGAAWRRVALCELARLGLSRHAECSACAPLSLDRQAELLATSEGTAGMLIERVALLPDGQPIDIRHPTTCGDAMISSHGSTPET